MIRNVLQINVRLSEGGAAGVARNLSYELNRRGVASPIAYGYSSRGRASPIEAQYSAVRLTPAVVAAANRARFYLLGDESEWKGPAHWRGFENAIAQADVVHFHAVHSHMARVSDLVEAVIAQRKPLAWTMHDQWHFTGRCAQPGDCRRWESGCVRCPNLAAYPPALIDRAVDHWPGRRDLLTKARESVPFALVACASWLQHEANQAGLGETRVITNSVDRTFWDQLSRVVRARRGDGLRHLLFVCRDLRDRNKVDWGALRALSELPGCRLTVVGDHAPTSLAGADMRPAVAGSAGMAALMAEHDELIFFSRVDYFPLTLAEALTAEMVVWAVSSPAALEFVANPGLMLCKSPQDLVDQVESGGGRAEMVPVGTDHKGEFSPDRMVDSYLSLYRELAGARK